VTDHLTYAGGTASNPTCPSGFTAGRLPYLRMAIQFLDKNGNDYRGDGTDIALASGAWSVGPDGIQGNGDDYPIPGAASQYTLHGDFFQSWVRDIAGSQNDLQGMVQRCINLVNAAPAAPPARFHHGLWRHMSRRAEVILGLLVAVVLVGVFWAAQGDSSATSASTTTRCVPGQPKVVNGTYYLHPDHHVNQCHEK
jgi:hypothetical protein